MKPQHRHPDAPPNPPWARLKIGETAGGYLSFYHADDLASLPVRAVTRVRDNKSDPNVETGTYGLFSTCQQKMRAGIVDSAPAYLFFVTRPRGQQRHVTGYYKMGWYTQGSFGGRDFALAADAVRFVDPIPSSALTGSLRSSVASRWRLSKRIGRDDAIVLANTIDSEPDRTAEYVAEIKRLERVNHFHSGYSYPTWRRSEGWDWAAAARYLAPPSDPGAGAQKNSSPTNWWRCSLCEVRIENRALLKACPACHELGTLRALAPTDLDQV